MERIIEKQDITYVDSNGNTVTKSATMVCFRPNQDPRSPWKGFPPWSPGRNYYFSISSDWYDDKASLPSASDVVFQLTLDGQPV